MAVSDSPFTGIGNNFLAVWFHSIILKVKEILQVTGLFLKAIHRIAFLFWMQLIERYSKSDLLSNYHSAT